MANVILVQRMISRAGLMNITMARFFQQKRESLLNLFIMKRIKPNMMLEIGRSV